MKTQENKNNKKATYTLLATFCFLLLATGYIAFDQYNQKLALQEQYGLEKSNMEQHVKESFQKIEQNLAQITSHEGQLQLSFEDDADNTKSQEERIQREIELIEELIAENNKIIDDLAFEVGTKDGQIKNYKSKVKGLEGRLAEYKTKAYQLEQTNALLAENLEIVNNENVELSFDNDHKAIQLKEKDEVIAKKEKELNTAYYVVGSFQELKEAEIVEKEGGLIGLGKTKTLKDNFNKTEFVEVDKTDARTIPVFNKKAELITTHHADSYEWIEEDGKVKWLKIKDPELFWENSKYLVVEADDGWNLNLAQAK